MKTITTLGMLSLLVFIFSYSEGYAKDDLEISKSYNRHSKIKPGQERPRWVDKLPMSIDSYVFVGTGSGSNKSAARKNAIQDALGQVVLIINATITTQSDFSSVYSESTKNDEVSLNESGYSRIKVKGQSAIKDFIVKATYYEREGKEVIAHVMAKVPKATIETAIAKMEQIRKELADTPTVIVAVTINPKKEVKESIELKSNLEQFYQSQGYNIISVDFDAGQLKGSTPRSHIAYLKKALTKDSKKVIYAAIYSKKVRESLLGTYTIIAVRGNLVITEVLLDSGKLVSVQNFRNKGISTQDSDQAFDKLVKNLLEDVFGKNKEEDDYF